jgi:hypothetical protein
MRPSTILALAASLAFACSTLACSAALPEADPLDQISETPLGGEALIQRKRDLDRTLTDLLHFHSTFTSLLDRKDGGAVALFDGFVATYMGEHLDPMLRSPWQSKHPELAAIDASLRFVKAELLIQMRYPREVQQTIEEIETRFKGREGLLIEYPIGRQGTLGAGLLILKDRKWKG